MVLCRLRLLRRPSLFPSGGGSHGLSEFGPMFRFSATFATKSKEPVVKKKTKKVKEKVKKKDKKGGAAGMSESDRHRFDELVEKALHAPSPYRHATEKERLREAELEKYGLMTKARQIELQQEKAREKERKKTAEAGIEEEPPLTWEEGQRLAKAYSRVLMKAHREHQAGESLRLRLKKAAIEALPPGLKEAALVPDYTPFPERSPATLTPPIPGFRYTFVSPKRKDTDHVVKGRTR